MAGNFFVKHKSIFLYGVALAILLFLLKWLEWRFVIISYALEVYIGVIALMFTGLGIWLTLKLTTPKVEQVIIEKEVYRPTSVNFTVNEAALRQLGISNREMEVLQLMAEGCTNQQIDEKLFLSLNTVKTDAAKLYEKLDVSRRTQAIDKGKKMGILP